MRIENYWYFCTGVIRAMKAVVLLTMVISYCFDSICLYLEKVHSTPFAMAAY
jgi:hypothetical protein